MCMYRTTIEELCLKVTSGGTPSRRNPDFYTGEIPWIKTGELKGWYINDSSERITSEAISSSSAKIYPKNTVLMAMYGDGGTIGSTAITSIEAASNQASCAMIPNQEKCHPLYLLFLLQMQREAIVALALGGAQRNLNQGTIKNFEVTVHDLKSQYEIARVLSSYNNLIENNNRRIAILEDMAQSLYREWFVKFRYPGHENQTLIDSALGPIPDGWEVEDFSDFIDFWNGKNSKSESGEYPLYGANGVIGQSDGWKYENAVIIGRVGAYCGAVEYCFDKFWGSDNTIIAKCKSQDSIAYLFLLLETFNLNNYAGGAAQPLLTQATLKRLQFALPPAVLIKEFEEIAYTLFESVVNLKKRNKNLKDQRNMLLPKLISGNIKI